MNTLFQKREALVSNIVEVTTDLFNVTVNSILLHDHRLMSVNNKLKLFENAKDPESKLITLDKKLMKNPDEFITHISHAYEINFDWQDIQKNESHVEMKKNMFEFVKRLAYKMTKLFPFDDPLLKLISCLNPNNFIFDNWNSLGEKYTHLMNGNFSLFYKQIQKFETEKESNVKIFESKEISNDLIKFYNHKTIKEKYGLMAKLSKSLLCLPFSNSEIERIFSQFKLTKTQLRTSLSDDTVEGLMLWKMNSELLDLNDDKIMQDICKEYEEIKESEKHKENEDGREKSLKRKLDEMTPNDQNSEKVLQKNAKHLKLTQSIDEGQDDLSQEIIRLELEPKNK